MTKTDEHSGVHIVGHIKIFNPENGHVYIDKRNAIHYENMSISLAESLGNAGEGFIYEMALVTEAQALTQQVLLHT